ncbi:MAG: NAD(P)H-dependent oxidoreductase [Paracoccus sp. (in: a-proteobacteria)]
MSGLKFVGFAGSFSSPSKTRQLVTEAADRAVARFGGTSHVFDIGDLGAAFGVASQPGRTPDLDRHLDAFLTADAVIVASPVYKGSYTGLFKHFIDLIDPLALLDKPVLLAATGGGHRHALIIEHQLRPLFAFFEARVLATGVYAASADFADGRLADEQTSARLDRALAQFADHLPHSAARPALRALA